MKTLKLYNIESIDHIVSPAEFDNITLKPLVLDIQTDLEKIKPLVIDEETEAVDTHIFMGETLFH